MDGVIEGFVRDQSHGVIVGGIVRAVNVDTGLVRRAVTDKAGRYRIPLVPPGRYALDCSFPGFKILQRTGLTVRAGELMMLDVELMAGPVAEAVTVSGEPSLTRPGAIDAGRTIPRGEFVMLPLVLRNPLNLALLVPGVTGNEADEITQPRLNANGAQMRNSYQIDGNTNTERDRAGLRLVPASPLFVSEIRVTTSGFAPEFGQASGIAINLVTPSGTNAWRGEVRGDLSLPSFVARPFLLPDGAPRPQTRAAVFLGTLSGPIRRDRLHLYAGYHRIRRDSSSALITVDPGDAARLGLTVPPSLVLDEGQTEHFGFAKVDSQISAAHRLSGRAVTVFNDSPQAGVAGLAVPDRAVDSFARMGSGAVQWTSVVGGAAVNEFRAQFAERSVLRRQSSTTASAPAIDISGVASFGGPYSAVQGVRADFDEASWQVIDNYAWQAGSHTIKAGVDVQRIVDRRVNTLRRVYTFSTIDSYLAAAGGGDRRGYSRYLEDIGNAAITYRTTFGSAFLQDDVRISPRLSLVYGVRYDVFGTPAPRDEADPGFRVDWNNVAPRAGAVWSLDRAARTVLRGSIGRVFDPAPLSLYEDALLHGRSGRIQTVILRPKSLGAPLFPAQVGAIAQPQSIVDIDGDFETQSAWLTQVEIERAIGTTTAVSAAYAHSTGRHLPVLMDENLIPTGVTLPDGRPVYSATVSAATRVDPQFDHLDVVQSSARADYDALILTMRTRWRRGVSLQASYTRARARDTSPLTNVYVQGSQDDRASDPSSLERDYGPGPFDQPHAFAMSALVSPQDWLRGRWSVVTRDTTVGLIVIANAGMPANLRSNLDLNGDGQMNDRPLDVGRNSGRVGRVAYADMKLERVLRPSGTAEVALSASIKNMFNTRNVQQVNRVIATDPSGLPLQPIPGTLPATATSDGRRIEIGISLRF